MREKPVRDSERVRVIWRENGEPRKQDRSVSRIRPRSESETGTHDGHEVADAGEGEGRVGNETKDKDDIACYRIRL